MTNLNNTSSASSGIPTIITSSSGTNSSYPATNLFDGNASTLWSTSDAAPWVQIQFPISTIISGCVVTSRGDQFTNQAPATIVIAGSNDGSTWTTLINYTFAAWVSQGQSQNVTFTNTTGYLYYKLTFTETSGASGGDTVLGEVSFTDQNDAPVSATSALPNTAITATGTNAIGTATRVATSRYTYAEFKPYKLTGSVSIGMSEWGFPNNTQLGTDGNYSFGYSSTGAVKINNTTIATLPTYGAGTVVGMAIDFLRKLLWFTTDGTTWNSGVTGTQDPSTGAGGISWFSMNYTNANALAVTLTNSGDSVIAYFSAASWTHTPPTGFNSLDICGLTIANDISINNTDPVTPIVTTTIAKGINVPNDTNSRYMVPAGAVTYVYGTVLEQKAPAAKTVRAYDSKSGKLITEVVSDPTTGYFSIPAIGSPKVDIVAKDVPNYQAQIFDELTPQ